PGPAAAPSARPRAFVADPAAGRPRLDQPRVAANHRALADNRLAAEDRGPGVDRHVVLERRVAPPARLARHAARQAERAERDALVELHVVPDRARLADHDARAVVDEERLADLGAGVDVDARVRVRVLRHDAGARGHAL